MSTSPYLIMRNAYEYFTEDYLESKKHDVFRIIPKNIMENLESHECFLHLLNLCSIHKKYEKEYISHAMIDDLQTYLDREQKTVTRDDKKHLIEMLIEYGENKIGDCYTYLFYVIMELGVE